jgi:hypothetical protein
LHSALHETIFTITVNRRRYLARSRFVEDLVVEQAGRGVSRYVILGLTNIPLLAVAIRQVGCVKRSEHVIIAI